MRLSIENVRFSYPENDFGLQIKSLEVDAGSSLALVGPSGCGKTTFLNLVSGLVTPQKGAITVGKDNLSTMSDRKRRAFRSEKTGYVFQDFGLVDYLTAQENILYPYLATGKARPDDPAKKAALLAAKLGIEHTLNKKPANLSQGEKQRVAVCRAMITNPALLLADEPTGNLDPANKTAIIEQLFHQSKNTGATLIVVTHDVELTKRFDQVVDFSQFRWSEKGEAA